MLEQNKSEIMQGCYSWRVLYLIFSSLVHWADIITELELDWIPPRDNSQVYPLLVSYSYELVTG